MRSLFGLLAQPLLMLVIGCNAVDPDECWPNTSGGFGGGGTIPIAGVGATSGDFGSPPPKGPLDDNGTSNPCMAPSNPDDGGSELGTYVRCRGLGPAACEGACFDIGAYCVAAAMHPYGSMAGGPGNLKQCQSNALNYTCTYCFPNGDVCTRTILKLAPPFWLCSYTGGKGCE